MKPWVLALGVILAATELPSAAQQLTADQLVTMEIKTQKVGDGLYVLFGAGDHVHRPHADALQR